MLLQPNHLQTISAQKPTVQPTSPNSTSHSKLPETNLCKTPQPVPFLQLYHTLSPIVEGSTSTNEGDDTLDNSKH